MIPKSVLAHFLFFDVCMVFVVLTVGIYHLGVFIEFILDIYDGARVFPVHGMWYVFKNIKRQKKVKLQVEFHQGYKPQLKSYLSRIRQSCSSILLYVYCNVSSMCQISLEILVMVVL